MPIAGRLHSALIGTATVVLAGPCLATNRGGRADPSLIEHRQAARWTHRALAVARAMQEENDMIVVTGHANLITETMNPDPHLAHIHATLHWHSPPRP